MPARQAIFPASLSSGTRPSRRALRTLQGAQDAGRAGGCTRALFDEGDELVALLEPSSVPGATPHPPANVQKAAWSSLLSQREHEILQLLCSGAPNREISEKLFLSENTVKFHLKNLYLKLDVRNRAQAILKAQRNSNAQ